METVGERIGYLHTSVSLGNLIIVERLFFHSGWALSDRRSRIKPDRFEQHMFLFMNVDFLELPDGILFWLPLLCNKLEIYK